MTTGSPGYSLSLTLLQASSPQWPGPCLPVPPRLTTSRLGPSIPEAGFPGVTKETTCNLPRVAKANSSVRSSPQPLALDVQVQK
jgi:hypothetical protein